MYFFREAPGYILKHLVEREAQKFRAYLGLDGDGCIDPFEVADWLGLDVVYPDALRHLSSETRQLLLETRQDDWSGMTVYLPNALVITVLNPTQSPGRLAATLMEEVAHVHLGHHPSILQLDPASGVMKRTYDRRMEDEAYWLGAATLVPKVGLKGRYAEGYTVMEAAQYYGVSVPMIRFRSNLHGLGRRAS